MGITDQLSLIEISYFQYIYYMRYIVDTDFANYWKFP